MSDTLTAFLVKHETCCVRTGMSRPLAEAIEATTIPTGALVVQPGDQLLVAMHDTHLTHEGAARLSDQLRERFPDATITVVGGVAALAVQHPTTGDPQ